jgi:short subunit dehydrogenase-like uncharacterized protein
MPQSLSSSRRNRAIAVFGASGHTGRFVVAELLRRGLSPIAIGNDNAKLAACGFERRGVPARCATIDDSPALDSAVQGAGAVINCAGPFLDTAPAVAAAALRARVHYLDLTAEQTSAQATLDAFDAPAREAGILVLPAMAFFGGLADLMATAVLGEAGDAEEIRVGVALDRWHPTHGTRVTGHRNTARRLAVSHGQLTPVPQPLPESCWEFPPPFGLQPVTELPFTETILMARHIRVAHLHSYLSQVALRDVRDSSTPPPAAADASGRSAQTFLVDVRVRQGSAIRRAIARGRDIYAVTAPLVCEAAQRLLEDKPAQSGAFAPGQIFDAKSFLGALSPQHLTWEIDELPPEPRA